MSKNPQENVHDSTNKLKHVDSMNLTRFRQQHLESVLNIEEIEEGEEESNSGSVRFTGELTEFINVVLPFEKREEKEADKGGPSTVAAPMQQQPAAAPIVSETKLGASMKREATHLFTELEPLTKRPKLDK